MSITFTPAGQDRFGEFRGLGISSIQFKITPRDGADVLVLENTFHARGGPARHLHYEQDEWFYAVEGEFVVEVGAERFSLTPGDSLVAPRRVPHAWAFAGGGRGRIPARSRVSRLWTSRATSTARGMSAPCWRTRKAQAAAREPAMSAPWWGVGTSVRRPRT